MHLKPDDKHHQVTKYQLCYKNVKFTKFSV